LISFLLLGLFACKREEKGYETLNITVEYRGDDNNYTLVNGTNYASKFGLDADIINVSVIGSDYLSSKIFLINNQFCLANTYKATTKGKLQIQTKYTISHIEVTLFGGTSSASLVISNTPYQISSDSLFPLTIQKNINEKSVSIHNGTTGNIYIKNITLYFDVYSEVPTKIINNYFNRDIMGSIPTIYTNLIEVWLDYEDPDKAVLLTIYDWDIFDTIKYETALDIHLPYNASWGGWYIEKFNLFIYTIWSSENNLYMIIIM